MPLRRLIVGGLVTTTIVTGLTMASPEAGPPDRGLIVVTAKDLPFRTGVGMPMRARRRPKS